MSLSKAFTITALLLAAVPTDPIARADNLVDGALTAGALTRPDGEGAFRHLQVLQAIADANGGNRAAGKPGYDRSADYVAEQLREAGYRVRFEEFDFPFFEERTPPVLLTSKPDGGQEPAPASAVRTLYNSGSNDVTARLRGVNLNLGATPSGSSSGCEPDHFKDFERGAIALVRRGTCQFQVKVDNATAAGAVGVVIMNQGTDGQVENFSGRLNHVVAVPVVGVTYELGRALDLAAQADGGAQVRLAVDAVAGKRVTRNVLADVASEGDGPLIVVGAHLDSVTEGPGINDNGSGTAAALEAALQFAKTTPQTGARVRFGFWGAEERGLVGSRHHVASLTEHERRNIAVYINLDMVGSPNYGRFLRGPGATGDAPAAVAQREFAAYFREHRLPVEERSNGGHSGSDDAAFSQKGIPTVALYTGAGGSKAASQASLFGGTADRPYDPCYHRPCDRVENINREVLEQNTRALMRALGVVAMSAPSAGAPVRKAAEPSK